MVKNKNGKEIALLSRKKKIIKRRLYSGTRENSGIVESEKTGNEKIEERDALMRGLEEIADEMNYCKRNEVPYEASERLNAFFTRYSDILDLCGKSEHIEKFTEVLDEVEKVRKNGFKQYSLSLDDFIKYYNSQELRGEWNREKLGEIYGDIGTLNRCMELMESASCEIANGGRTGEGRIQGVNKNEAMNRFLAIYDVYEELVKESNKEGKSEDIENYQIRARELFELAALSYKGEIGFLDVSMSRYFSKD